MDGPSPLSEFERMFRQEYEAMVRDIAVSLGRPNPIFDIIIAADAADRKAHPIRWRLARLHTWWRNHIVAAVETLRHGPWCD